ncbi:hypothetical protein [Agromyces cerinus]|uniref:Uncharacterized protein n=1 Tax=Agromyces cerinus subsp. cerinus TaxID=232089 RepID=A0A1N6DJG6_9MICO|nr:hypothetical protein [Agromyces cerinus]SIN70813.1 hypothetical protein SAMN05443544_0305 [Agromyces cerinus subsp. cerinus]
MRWDLLFDDLESQIDQEQRDEERALAIEEERLRLGRLTLRDRLSAIARSDPDDHGAFVRIELHGGRILSLRPQVFGRDWVSGRTAEPAQNDLQCVVPIAAIAAVLPTRAQLEPSLESVPEASARIAERIGLPFVLRDLCRRRTPVRVSTVDGESHGTIDRVARDHLDLALHDADRPRRDSAVHGYRIVPLSRLLVVDFR